MSFILIPESKMKPLSLAGAICIALALSSCERENERDVPVDTEPRVGAAEPREDINTDATGQTSAEELPMATPDMPNPALRAGDRTDSPNNNTNAVPQEDMDEEP